MQRKKGVQNWFYWSFSILLYKGEKHFIYPFIYLSQMSSSWSTNMFLTRSFICELFFFFFYYLLNIFLLPENQTNSNLITFQKEISLWMVQSDCPFATGVYLVMQREWGWGLPLAPDKILPLRSMPQVNLHTHAKRLRVYSSWMQYQNCCVDYVSEKKYRSKNGRVSVSYVYILGGSHDCLIWCNCTELLWVA